MFNLKNTQWIFNEDFSSSNWREAIEIKEIRIPFYFKQKDKLIECNKITFNLKDEVGDIYTMYYCGIDGINHTAITRTTGTFAQDWENSRIILIKNENVLFDEKSGIYKFLTSIAQLTVPADMNGNHSYIHLYYRNNKVIVDSAVRDGEGRKISTCYVTKPELKTEIDEAVQSLTSQHTADINSILEKILGSNIDIETSIYDYISTLQSDISILQSDIIDLESKHTLQEDAISSLRNTFLATKNEVNKTIEDFNVKISKETEKINGLSTSVDAGLKTIENYDTRLANVEGFIESHSTSIEDIQDTLKNIAEDQIGEIASNIKKANEKILFIEEEIEKDGGIKQNIASNAEEIKNIKELYATIEYVNSEISKFTTSDDLNNLKEKLEGDIGGLSGLITANESNIETNANNIATNVANISDNTKSIDAIRQQIGNLGAADLEALQQRIEKVNSDLQENIEGVVSSINEDIADINDDISDINGQINALQQKDIEHNNALSNLNISLDELWDYCNNLDSSAGENSTLVDYITNLRTNIIPAQQNAINSQGSSIAILIDNVSSLDTQQKIHTSTINTHTTDIASLKEEVNKKQDKLTAGPNIIITYDEDTKKTTISSAAKVSNSWGDISGILADQTDLMEELNLKVYVSDIEETDKTIIFPLDKQTQL